MTVALIAARVFADPAKKNIQRFKEKLALNRWLFFLVGSTKLELLRAAPPMI
jgi:hypothetical protein